MNVGHAVITLAEQSTEDLAPVLPLLDALEQAALDARDVLTGQGHLASNYTAWLNAAGVAASRGGAAARGQEWDGAGRWLEGEHGLYAHLRVAVADDGWEWEGSTYYHGFVLRAALLALRGTDPAAVPSDVVDVLAGMTDVLAAIATPGGILAGAARRPVSAPSARPGVARTRGSGSAVGALSGTGSGGRAGPCRARRAGRRARPGAGRLVRRTAAAAAAADPVR